MRVLEVVGRQGVRRAAVARETQMEDVEPVVAVVAVMAAAVDAAVEDVEGEFSGILIWPD